MSRQEERGRRILVIDDEPTVRELIARHFRRAGDQVVVAASAEDVRARGHTQRTWDVVVTDIHLPGESGVELARELAERTTALILVTGDPDHVLATEALKGLRAGYLLKPFELFELDAAVKLATGGVRGSSPEWVTRAKHIAKALPGTKPLKVPARALLLSLAAMLAPIAGMMFQVNGQTPQELLLWVSALIPPFLMSYYRGWKGSAGALALGMATMVLGQTVASGMGATLPDSGTLLSMLVIFIITCLGAGWLSNALHQHRVEAEANALTDPLTGLANRSHMELFLNHRFAAAQRGHTKLAVVFFDLDNFKLWNDELGHEAGDKALTTFADVLKRNMRAENLAARYGGEEFVTILNEADYAGVMVFVERIREGLRHVRPYGRKLTASIGVAFQWEGLSHPQDMLDAADAAVYTAKAAGNDCVRVFGHETDNVRKDVSQPPAPAVLPAAA